MIHSLQATPYQRGHLDGMTPRDFFNSKAYLAEKLQATLDTQSGQAVTVFRNGKPIAVVGYCHLWDGVAEVFSILTEEIVDVRFSFHKIILGMLDTLQFGKAYHRLQFSVRDGFPPAQRWAESLGFDQEGLMRQYGPDKADHYLFARCV